jgi:glycerophosphoryl diester phosphodiesterase
VALNVGLKGVVYQPRYDAASAGSGVFRKCAGSRFRLLCTREAHIKPDRTLEALYLEPLKRWVSENGGRVYRDGDRFTLLIDIKTEGEPTYKALTETLSKYADILTVVRDSKVQPGAVTAVVSGNRPKEYMRAEQVRYAGYGGRMPDLNSDVPASFMPLLSDNWTKVFTWKGEGAMPAEEKTRLQDIVRTAHGKGWAIRFWATPDKPGPERDAIWKELKAAGVDKINTDDREGLQRFLGQ